MKKIIAIVLALVAVIPMSAKLTQFIVRGYVVKQDYTKADWYKESLDSVFIALVQNDTVPVEFRMISGDNNLKMTTESEFRLLAQGGVGSYSLILNREGYEPLRHDFKVVSEGQDIVYVRTLVMEPRRDHMLNEVEVTGTAIKMVMKGDTIVYDSKAFKLAEGSTLDALVRQLPGAQLDDDGVITVNGKKVSSLLLDGNDFFKGDPEIALKNLPAYTVDKIKVYDKTSKDDYITLESQTLSSTQEDENIVMDVILKKEFSMATILSAEAGYGPGIFPKESEKRLDSRYLGRAFAIGFSKSYRWSIYGGYNNINNTSKASSQNKDWGDNWGTSESGDGDITVGGMDVFYQPNKKVELGATISYERQDLNSETMSAITNFYDTGNLYQRSSSLRQSLSNNIWTSADFRYNGDKFTISVYPSFHWTESQTTGYNRLVNFNRNPYERYRGAALDSIYSGIASVSLTDAISSSTYRSYNNDPSSKTINSNININATWRPTKGRGLFRLSASGSDSKNTPKSGNMIYQMFMADPNATETRQQQWDTSKSRSDNFGTNICYDWDKRIIGEKWIKTLTVQPAVGWDIDRVFNDNVMQAQYILDNIDVSSNPLPSVTAPENILPLLKYDGNNSVKSLNLQNDILGRLYTGFDVEPSAPTDSGINPAFGVKIRYNHRQYWRHFTYDKPYAEPEFHYGINSCDPTDYMSVSLNFKSQNKFRNFRLGCSYYYESSLRNLSSLVPTINSSDPLNIYYGPTEGEKFPIPYSHVIYLNGNYYNNKSHQMGYFYASYTKKENQLSQSSVFDPTTGITTHRTMSINGNWNFNSYATYIIPFGKNDCWNIDFAINYYRGNSVDYVSSIGTPARSTVVESTLGVDFFISYKLKNGTSFFIGGKPSNERFTSPRTDFTNLNIWDTRLRGGIGFYLPWQIDGETTVSANIRSGYEDTSLNRTNWVWNATIRKSILKGALTFKLNAVDILGQLSNISTNVNAQGRTETWTNALPRYVMLTVAYRFNFTPKALSVSTD